MEPPACLDREAPSVRERLRAAIRAKRVGRKNGAQLTQLNNALSMLTPGESTGGCTNLRAAHKELRRKQKKILSQTAGGGGSTASKMDTRYIDTTEERTEVGAEPESRPKLIGPTECV
jgi:hypothetical protein